MITSYDYTNMDEKEINKIFNEKIKAREYIRTEEGYSSCDQEEYYREAKTFNTMQGNARNQAKSYFSSLFSKEYTEIVVRREPSLDEYKDVLTGGKVSKYDLRHSHFMQGLTKFVDKYKGKLCHIRTDNGFWGYNHSGYTHHIFKAGIYTIEEGYNILHGCGLDKQGALYVIDEDDLEGYIDPVEEHLRTLKSWRNLIGHK